MSEPPSNRNGGALRRVDTPGGPISYCLEHKPVKNWSLRIRRDGTVALSAPLHCSDGRCDQLVQEKWAWIQSHLVRRDAAPGLPPEPDRETCRALLAAALERTYPLVRPLGVPMPLLKLRRMKSQWGNCPYRQGYITLNTALACCPESLRDYVALHELVHFLHPDHGPGFYARMDRLMPDWRQRRQSQKRYVPAAE